MQLSYEGTIEGLSSWFNNIWSAEVNLKLILEHLLLIGSFPNARYDPVLWSLVHEMRISLIFPFLMLLIIRVNWKKALIVGGMFLVISWVGYLTIRESVYGTVYDFSLTIQFISMFIIGALLAKYRFKLIEIMRSFTFRKKMFMFVIGIAFYLYAKPAKVLELILGGRDPIIANILDSYCISLGAAILIILTLTSHKISGFLLMKPLHFLGKISYSLYLYHSVILLTFVHLFYNALNIGLIWFISLTGSLLISSLSYYFVEVPSIKLGRKLLSYRYKLNVNGTGMAGLEKK